MKQHIKNITVVSILFLMAQSSYAQPAITLEAFYGWLWTSSAGYNNNIVVDDKSNYGIRVGVSPRSQMVVEFEWNHTETNLQWTDITQQNEDVILNYYMLGFNKEMAEGPAVPFGIVNLGIMNVQGKTISFSEDWFTVGLGGGLKYYMSDRIGIRLQARLLLPMQFGGIGLGCGTGGCGGGVSAYTTTIQGDFTGGVILKLGG